MTRRERMLDLLEHYKEHRQTALDLHKKALHHVKAARATTDRTMAAGHLVKAREHHADALEYARLGGIQLKDPESK